MAPESRELHDHKDWLGFLQPVGLVVTPPALLAAGAILPRNVIPQHQRFLSLIEKRRIARDGAGKPAKSATTEVQALKDLPSFLCEVLDWRPSDIAGAPGGPVLPDSLSQPLPDYGEILQPTFAVPDPENAGAFLMLIEEVKTGLSLDDKSDNEARLWEASPEARFERLLRENDVAIGLLSNGTHLRLVYAPRGETSGHVTFPIAAMSEVAGRPIFAALYLLLHADRVFGMLSAREQLRSILKDSRRYQNEVSTRLADQVLSALWELLRGFQAADDLSGGDLLREVKTDALSSSTEIYGGLLTTILRLVFILYAEDQGVMPTDGLYVSHYSLTGLFARLREDAARHPDTMDQRYGAWAQMLVLFRLIHDGAAHGTLKLPPRDGNLFSPSAYPFLEGRTLGGGRQKDVTADRLRVPRVADGVLFRVLSNLVLLDGERLSYRNLDVEQIGSVYQAMMGFSLARTEGASIAVRAGKVDEVVNLDQLISLGGADRIKQLAKDTKIELSGKAADQFKAARTPSELVSALGKKVAVSRTPHVLPAGSMYLLPTEERRRSGSHYTPRSLTGPIVRTTLRPIFESFGGSPTPEQILDLKICDPAVGSGAFLVETCRYLGDELASAWARTKTLPVLPPDEDPVLHARRLVAQRCLYGVDRNRFAVDLAKLSLWLVTLAKSHPFTFLDHAIRLGDSLVGLGREQIASFDWAPKSQLPILRPLVDAHIKEAERLRQRIHDLGDSDDNDEKRRLLKDADDALSDVRRIGDAVIAAFFLEEKEKQRKARLQKYGDLAASCMYEEDFSPLNEIAEELRSTEHPVTPFHWEIEFPEVFSRGNPGFDCFVGNPPFAGKNTITAGSGSNYLSWWLTSYEFAHGNSDLGAYFFRRAYSQLRTNATFGLIATNTIAQGDTRTSGLCWICTNGGTIYEAVHRLKWPGTASVVVSIVHVIKKSPIAVARLDGRDVARISAFLFHSGSDRNPVSLIANEKLAFIGSNVLGLGFIFEDERVESTALATMRDLIQSNPRNQERIFPYIGGEELNSNPAPIPMRHIINFEELREEEARTWPDLFEIVERKVKGTRGRHAQAPYWQFERPRSELYRVIKPLSRVIVVARVSRTCAFTFLPSDIVFNEKIVVFAFDDDASFSILQSRIHEGWARFFSSTLKDDLQYTPSQCFKTFPFPEAWKDRLSLRNCGESYFEMRSRLMVDNNQGLTATYNRFHDPEERDPDILKLRAVHDEMDRAVLDAYGWSDIRPTCEFILDYEEEETEEEAGRARKKKKPWRYRWPDEIRDEVLARLIALNAERAAEEKRLGLDAEQPESPSRREGQGEGDVMRGQQSESPSPGLSLRERGLSAGEGEREGEGEGEGEREEEREGGGGGGQPVTKKSPRKKK